MGVGVAFGFGVCVGFGFTLCFAFGLGVTAGVGFGLGDGVWTGFVDVAPVAACLVGVGARVDFGDGVPGIASRNGPSAGSAVAEFLNALRPFQLSANAVNATTMTAKAANASVDRRDHLKPKSLNTRTRYWKSAAMQVPRRLVVSAALAPFQSTIFAYI